ncbi:hypothetical protein BX600DRAFT_511085 [Xylariales sp. PMI_506]|nr:hypothetical protein BX600DRAFT_511085 [Xylariales sp. PMI_506]
MSNRRSFDSIDDLEGLVEHSPSGFPTKGSRSERNGQRWLSGLKAIGLCAAGVLVGFYWGTWSMVDRPQAGSWVSGPLGAPYINSPVYEDLPSSQAVILGETEIGTENLYSGNPASPKVAKAWKDLLKGYNVRVPGHLLKPGQESIPVADDSGDVMASLSVYHHLHCLDSIRHQLAGVACTDNDWGADGKFPWHLDHCIDTIRQWIMCQPDLTVRTIYWTATDTGRRYALANNTIEHACVDWSLVSEWTSKRELTTDDGLIRTPEGEIWKQVFSPPARCSTHDVSGNLV